AQDAGEGEQGIEFPKRTSISLELPAHFQNLPLSKPTTRMNSKLYLTRWSGRFAALATLALALPAFGQNGGDYRSVASGNWNSLGTWETYDGANWVPASATPTAANAGIITIQSPDFVTNSASLTSDQIV